MNLPNKTKDQTQRKVQKKSSKPKKHQSKGKKGCISGQIMQKNASIVFSKSKPESSGPGDLALEKKSQPRAKTEICHRKMQPWSHFNCVHPNLSKLFFYFPISFPILNRQRQGPVLLWTFRVEPLRGKSSRVQPYFSTFFNPVNILPRMLSTYCL